MSDQGLTPEQTAAMDTHIATVAKLAGAALVQSESVAERVPAAVPESFRDDYRRLIMTAINGGGLTVGDLAVVSTMLGAMVTAREARAEAEAWKAAMETPQEVPPGWRAEDLGQAVGQLATPETEAERRGVAMALYEQESAFAPAPKRDPLVIGTIAHAGRGRLSSLVAIAAMANAQSRHLTDAQSSADASQTRVGAELQRPL